MKNRRVLRGTCRTASQDGAVQLIQDDGNWNDAWRVIDFSVSYSFLNGGTPAAFDLTGTLATSEDAFGDNFPTEVYWWWQDRRQIAWTSFGMTGLSDVTHWRENKLIDPTHYVQRELWVAIDSATAFSTSYFNYYVELERVHLDDTQALMTIISERN